MCDGAAVLPGGKLYECFAHHNSPGRLLTASCFLRCQRRFNGRLVYGRLAAVYDSCLVCVFIKEDFTCRSFMDKVTATRLREKLFGPPLLEVFSFNLSAGVCVGWGNAVYMNSS